ncbi:MAG TPA: hypothetical protein VI488_14375 [Candidatus Angelobacter sp.]
MKRAGIVGSVGGTLVLGALLLRNSAPAPTPATPQAGTQSKASSTLRRSTNTAKREHPGTAGDGQKDDRLSEDGPWNASQDHFAGAWPGRECPAAEIVDAGKKSVAALNGVSLVLQGDERERPIRNPRSDLWCIPDRERVAAMIAIAPDPAHTHLALMFDRTVEAIQLAAGSANYVIDRYWLPWDAAPRTDWADYNSLQRATEDQKQNEKQPGLLLYRWDGKQEVDSNGRAKHAAVLYVFLVTDTSTAGINGEQFSHSVGYVNEVCAQAGGCVGDGTIHIMGPTFSGSLDSLRRLTAANAPHSFTANSGTVSSSSAISNQRLPFRFQSMVNETESAVSAFIEELMHDRDIACDGSPEVAILSEAGTTFGGVTFGRCYTSFVYPREIASLRNAYQAAGSGGTANTAATPASPYLPLELTDRSNGGDEPPDFSNPQGPLSKEAVLMNDAAEMRRDHYRYIGISATNVLDALFLSKFLRTAVPDARLFIISDSDLMFERALDNSSYIGTLAITNYPLAPRWNWTSTGQLPLDLPLADQYEWGQYNASVFTIREALGYQPADTQAPGALHGCSTPCSQAKLPLWLTAVGTGGYWPVQMLASTGQTLPPAPNLTVLRGNDFSTAWKVVCVLLCALAWVQALVLLASSPIASHFRDFAFVDALPEQRLFFINVASASLAFALAMVAMPLHLRSNAGSIVGLIAGAVLVSILLLLAACLILHACLIWRSKWERKEKKDRRPLGRAPLVSLLVWTLALGASALWWRLFTSDPTLYGYFFAYRSVNLATGVSPVMPMLLLLAAVYLWSVFEIWRLRFNELSRPRVRTKRPFPGARNAGRSTEKDASVAVYAFRLKNSYLVGLVATYLLWFLALNPWHPFQLFERPLFGQIYGTLLCIVVLMMLSKGFRLGQIWWELRALLFDLDRSPIRLAFGRLEGFDWSPIWRQGGQEAEWVFMARSFEALRRLGNCDLRLCRSSQPPAGSDDPKLKEIHERLWSMLRELEKGGDRSGLQSQLDRTRSELDEIASGIQGSDGCKLSLLRAIRRDLAAIDAILNLPDVIARTEGETNRILKVVRQIRERGPLFFLLRTARCYRGSGHPKDKDLPDFEKFLGALQRRLARALYYTLDILNFHWNKPRGDGGKSDEPKEKPAGTQARQENADPEATQVEILEQFAALRYVSFIRAVLAQLRHCLIFLAISFSLILLSLNVYSFEPHQSLIWSFTAIFVIVGFIVVVVLMQVHRDPILARITRTEANELGLPFYVRIFSIGLVPLLTLLSAHFPAIGHSLTSFLQPGLDALK